MVTVNCYHVLQGEPTLIVDVAVIVNDDDHDDGDADDGKLIAHRLQGVDGIELQKHPSIDIHTI